MNKICTVLFVFLSFFSFSQQDVKFSHEAGFYENPFYLKVDSSFGTIFYSFQNNLNRRSRIFSDSLLIDKNTTLSFGLYVGDSIVKLGSKSYFIGFETKFDVVSLTISHKTLYDSISGIYMHGPHAYYDTNLHVMLNSNYSKKSEREIYVEIFDSSGNRIVNQDAGIRIFGGMTIYYPEKSLRLIARKKYGESRFKANIFNQGKKKYKQFILRHSGNDYRKTRFKDVLSTTLAAQSGLDVQAFVPSHLFVNSEYWGVYNIREKLNEYYIDNNYDCGTEGVDLLQAFKKVEEGTVDKYEELLNFIDNNKMKVDENYNHLSTLMDTRNFTNYWIYQMYFGNTDARGNIRFWRSDSLDGKFRWIIYDTDLGWGNYRSTLLDDFTSPIKTKWYNPTWSTYLLRNLLKNKTFERDFINQSAYLLSSLLNTENVQNKISEFEEMYKQEMVYHFENRKKFQSYQGNLKKWQKEVNQLKFFALKRDNALLSQIQKKFHFSDPYNLNISVENSENGKVLLNNNELINSTFSGTFFSELDLPISIVPNVGYSFSGYNKSIIENKNGENISIHIVFIQNQKSDKKVVINEIDYKNDCIEIFNQENESINLKAWKIVDKNNNVYTVENGILKPKSFAVFHLKQVKKMDSVLYYNIDFGISSTNECIALYDGQGNFVDSIGYKLTEIENSYSRNIPFENVEQTTIVWENNSDVTIGFHNGTYTELTTSIQKRKTKYSIILYSGITILILLISFFIYRKKKSTLKS